MIKKLDNAFEIYDTHLKNKKVVIELDNKEIITCVFLKKNFQHLTGVKHYKDISSKQFYDNYKSKKINKEKLTFDDNSKMKLSVFDNLKFKVGQDIIAHKNSEYLNISFRSEHHISKNSAILCIEKNYPKSLLKKNFPIQGENIKGKIVSIEPFDNK